jgi:hypothetical protein
MEPDPGVAVAVPPQVLLRFAVGATTRPAGSASVNANPLKAKALGFWILKVRLVMPFSGIEAEPNALVMLGGVATVRLADAMLPVPPLVELTAPDVLVY